LDLGVQPFNVGQDGNEWFWIDRYQFQTMPILDFDFHGCILEKV
jgi:hypothetical protein